MKTVANITVLTLAVAAVVLGYILAQRSGFSLPSFNTSNNTKTATQSATQIAIPDEDKKALLNFSSNNALSDDDKRKYFELANKYAQTSRDIRIAGCQPTPLVLKVSQDQPFDLFNSDPFSHTISVDKDHVYTIPAASTLPLKANFGYGPGEYFYYCDSSALAVGVIHVVAAR